MFEPYDLFVEDYYDEVEEKDEHEPLEINRLTENLYWFIQDLKRSPDINVKKHIHKTYRRDVS